MNERLKKLRKSLELTQQKFADKLGVKRNTVGQWECGINALTDHVIFSICREFNVNEEWLRNGTGEMFKATPHSTLDELAQQYHFSSNDYVIVEQFSNLNREERDVILNFIKKVAAECDNIQPNISTAPELSALDIDKKVELYRRELENEKKVAVKSEALQENA